MSDCFIQDITINELGNQIRRIHNLTDPLSIYEVMELFSRTEGTIKQTGKYHVRAVNTGDVSIKSGYYDTGEIFALPDKADNIIEYITNPDGTTEWKTITKFQDWSSHIPITNNYVIVDDSPIDIGCVLEPVDDMFIIVVNISQPNTTINLRINSLRSIDWGDGTVDNYSDPVYNPTHTYITAGKYLIKIPQQNCSITTSIWADGLTCNSIEGVVAAAWMCSATNGIYGWFKGLINLKYVILPNGTLFSNNTSQEQFKNCNSLEFIVLPNSTMSYMNEDIFAYSGIKNIILPFGITNIPNYAFHECSNLTNIILPNSLTTIGSSAFRNCINLSSIKIPDSITDIGESAFSGCSSLQEVVLSKNITTIKPHTFTDCASLTNIAGLENVTTIMDSAFYGDYTDNTLIKKLVFPSVTSLGVRSLSCFSQLKILVLSANNICELKVDNGVDAFEGTKIPVYQNYNDVAIYVPDNLVNDYKSNTNWSKYSSIIEPLSQYSEN